MSSRRSATDPYGPWVKSTRSGYSGNCIEVAGLTGGTVRVRDSKKPDGGMLSFSPTEWSAFLEGVHGGQFGRQLRL